MTAASVKDETFDHNEFVTYFRDEALKLLRCINENVLTLEANLTDDEHDTAIVHTIFRSVHTIKGSAAMQAFTVVQRVAHHLEQVIDLLRLKHISVDERLLELIFAGCDLLEILITRSVAGSMHHSAEVDEYIVELEDFIGRVCIDDTVLDELLPAQMADPQDNNKEPTKRLATQRVLIDENTIRVDITRLDRLVEHVGELLMTYHQIIDISERLVDHIGHSEVRANELFERLHHGLAKLERITEALQHGAMQVRMIPVGQVFERFPRMIRDLASALGKNAQTIISGATTYLDKNVIDQLGEPLMHIVRNCVDHGLEDPQERAMAQKTPIGTIHLNAYHEGNKVIVEVSDDGRGIATEKIRCAAIEQGMLDPTLDYSEQELLDVIFIPGFTTAAFVTGLSGRGIGMDTVRQAIERLKGQLEVISAPGLGIKFVVRLPLTLATLSVLIARVAGCAVAIPLDMILECQYVQESLVHDVANLAVTIARGEVLPLLNVAGLFGEIDTSNSCDVIVVQYKGRRIGLVVDEIQTQHDIVMKPIPGLLGEIPHVAGAAILGTGDIALVLDVAAVFDSAFLTNEASSHVHPSVGRR